MESALRLSWYYLFRFRVSWYRFRGEGLDGHELTQHPSSEPDWAAVQGCS